MITTQRLILRPLELTDIHPLHQCILRSLGSLQRWLVWSLNASLESTRRFVELSFSQPINAKPKFLPLAMILKDNSTIIGMTGFNEMGDTYVPYYEIGYWIDESYSGLGLTTEAVKALTSFAFDKLQAQRVQICCQAENLASKRVAEKAGFEFEARLKRQYRDLKSGEICDRLIFAKFSK